jgi:carbon monoxide dehydrogenase subunit G
MRTAERSTTLDRPANAVFAFLADIGNLPRWQSGVVRAEQTSPGPMAVGTTAVVERRLMGQDVRADLRVTRFEQDRAIVLETDASGLHVEASISLEVVDAMQCRVTFGMAMEATNVFMRPLEAMVAQAAEGDIGASLEALRREID